MEVMMRSRSWKGIPSLGVFGLWCLIGSTAIASQDDVLRFTIPQAIEVALRLNPAVLETREQISEFNQLVRQARSEALPKVDAFVSWQRNRDPGLRNSPFFSRLLEGPDPIPPEALEAFKFTNYVWRLEVEQPIYTFGRVSNAQRAARDELRGVRYDVAEVENRISRDVAVACYGYLLAEQRRSVLEKEREARQRQLQQVEDRFELGDATRLDVLRANVALANLRPEILAAENDLELSRAVVNDTLGRPVGAPIVIAEVLEIPEPRPDVGSPEELMVQANGRRPELLRFAVDRQVLDARVGVTRADVLPEIAANALFGVDTFDADNFADPGFRSWNVGFAVRWTVFDGLRASSEIGALRSQALQSRHEEDSFRSGLALDLERATGTWERALEAVDVAEMAVEQAREAERVAEESFRWGAATVLDVLEAERALRQAEFNRAQAAHDALAALAELKYLVGFRADASHAVISAAKGDRPAGSGVGR